MLKLIIHLRQIGTLEYPCLLLRYNIHNMHKGLWVYACMNREGPGKCLHSVIICLHSASAYKLCSYGSYHLPQKLWNLFLGLYSNYLISGNNFLSWILSSVEKFPHSNPPTNLYFPFLNSFLPWILVAL